MPVRLRCDAQDRRRAEALENYKITSYHGNAEITFLVVDQPAI